jgi:lipopolysaccharide transport system ATP-binding protein
MNNQIAIKVSGLSKKYALNKAVIDEKNQAFSNDLWALNNISFEINKGAVVGIIGANGSGKSTLLKILSGITKPTKGEALLTGRVASILDIGAGFHSELSGYDNIFLHGQILGFKPSDIEKHTY